LQQHSITVKAIDVKKIYIFILVTFFYVFNVFLFSKSFLFLKKTLAKFRAASRLTRSTFKITATKETYDFLLHVKRPEMPHYKLLLTYCAALCDGLEGHFLGITRAWS